MKPISSENDTILSTSKALKAGVWYTACTFLQKALAFLTTPFFTRLMLKEDVGYFSNFSTWMSLFIIITTFDLPMSIIRSKHEYKEDIDSYCSSILALSTFINIIFLSLLWTLKSDILDNIMEKSSAYFWVIALYLLFNPAIEIYATKQRAYYKYKSYAVITFVSSIVSTCLAIALVSLMQNKVQARIIGSYLPFAIIGFVLYFVIAARGKKVNFNYCIYGLKMCLPLLPHLLALYILGSSDKIMITKMVGAEYTAIYSIAYSCMHILTLLMTSMNRSWAPWMLDMLEYKQFDRLKKAGTPYILAFEFVLFGVMLISPEVIWIMGGTAYMDAIYAMPPLLCSCLFMLIYHMYLQTEFYEKKTYFVGFGTLLSALINIALNICLIPRYGYVAAAYTTLIGYVFLLLFHYVYASILGYARVFDLKIVFGACGTSILLMLMASLLYRTTVLRYICICFMIMIAVMWLLKNKEKIVRRVIKR